MLHRLTWKLYMGLISQLSYGKQQGREELWPRDNDKMPVISEPQFSAALRQERRRTERSKRPFLLMLADMEAITRNSATTFPQLSSALAAVFRETDTSGWHRQNEVLGAIFTELGKNDRSSVLLSIKQKAIAVIHDKLGARDAKKVKLNFHFFPEESGSEEQPATGLPAECYAEPNPRRVARTLKRVIDVLGSTLLLIAFLPLLVLIGIIIKLTSKGPTLFRQVRVGQYGKEFTFLKFRSMYANNDAALHKEYVSHFIAGKAQMKESADGKTSAYKVINDPRVTPFGRLLRKTSLDELPQLINVLNGKMSLVGPRPPLPYEFDCYDVWHMRRIAEIKPVVTGMC